MNKAKEVREALGLTQTEAGRLFSGNQRRPYDIWSRWETTGKWPAPADQMFKIILTLVMMRDLNTPGSGRALDIVLDMLQDDDEEGT